MAVYPRVGGATEVPWRVSSACLGLSPRGRGNHRFAVQCIQSFRSIPAWAGQPIPAFAMGLGGEVYPRVGGATLGLFWPLLLARGLSPRGRGNRRGGDGLGKTARSIPAWAGQPSLTPTRLPRSGVYPRVGGATSVSSPRAPDRRGLSPRGRGNHDGARQHHCQGGSIPAWAGQPEAPATKEMLVTVYPRVGGATVTVSA